MLNSSDLSVEEITGCLKAVEDNGDVGDGHEGKKLYLTEEQWLERYKQKEKVGHGGGSGGDGHGKGGRGNKGGWIRWQNHFERWERGRVQTTGGPKQREMPQLWQNWPLDPGLS
jgi:hypothetical protein